MQKMKNRKKTKSSSNSTRISEFKYLPPELCTQILANLPAKTVLRFRCVCKSWCDIIDNPDFVTQHRNLCKINSVSSKLLLSFECLGRFGRKGRLLTVRHADALRKTDHILKTLQRYDINGSCNELLLIRGLTGLGERNPLMLWNPCIRKSLSIPLPPLLSSCDGRVVYAFGFAPNSNDYKVVAMSSQWSQADGWNVCFAVYTLSDQQWSLRNDGFNMSYPYYSRMFSRYCCPQTGFNFQGARYWISYDPNRNGNLADNSTHLVILDFDLEKFNYMELPFASDDRGAVRLPFRLRESLAVFCISSVKSSIWSLEGDSRNGVWTQRFSGLSSSDGFDLFRSGPFLPLFYYESDDGGRFVYWKKSYNISSCQIHELGKSMKHYVNMLMYMEGLVLCKGYGAEDLGSCS
ncbi:F-box/kelch-repeat protein At3g23880-like [Silene latifolia]|uniref:F-box/kelch-repeat protein At3g23880-like n=1 Tax=Silene latifolia TaxID=37657 RepID=UPI003D773030